MAADGRVTKANRKTKGRSRPLPPDVNARNLAIEKQRREILKERLTELAGLVPVLASDQRLSKLRIVEETARYLRQQKALSAATTQKMQNIMTENTRLVSELNAALYHLGRPPITLADFPETSDISQQLMNRSDETSVAPSVNHGEFSSHSVNNYQDIETGMPFDTPLDPCASLDSSMTVYDPVAPSSFNRLDNGASLSQEPSLLPGPDDPSGNPWQPLPSTDFQDNFLCTAFAEQSLPVDAQDNPSPELLRGPLVDKMPFYRQGYP